MIAFFLLLLVAVAFAPVAPQLSILENYSTCLAFAINGTGISQIPQMPTLLQILTGPTFVPGIFHNGYLVHTQAEATLVMNARTRLTGNAFLPAISVVDYGTFCGQPAVLDLTAWISDVTQGFFEVSMVNDLDQVNFYSLMYAQFGVQKLYEAINTVDPCSVVEAYLNDLDVPVFFTLPALPVEGNVTGTLFKSLFVRDFLGVIQVVCGV